jgi:hypothetical protein
MLVTSMYGSQVRYPSLNNSCRSWKPMWFNYLCQWFIISNVGEFCETFCKVVIVSLYKPLVKSLWHVATIFWGVKTITIQQLILPKFTTHPMFGITPIERMFLFLPCTQNIIHNLYSSLESNYIFALALHFMNVAHSRFDIGMTYKFLTFWKDPLPMTWLVALELTYRLVYLFAVICMDNIIASNSCSFGGCCISLVEVVSSTWSLCITLITLIKQIIIRKKPKRLKKNLHIFFYFIVVVWQVDNGDISCGGFGKNGHFFHQWPSWLHLL